MSSPWWVLWLGAVACAAAPAEPTVVRPPRLAFATLADSPAVSWAATCGTITATGLYTAPTTPPATGRCLVIAANAAGADTADVRFTAAIVTGGTPFGPSQQLDAGGPFRPFTMTSDAMTPANVASRIAAARTGRYHLVLALTGGAHDKYLSVINGVLQFDLAKWRAAMDLYNTPAIRQAIADGVKDGTILGNNVMDEPQVSGAGDGNTWGPPGTMTKAKVDGLCSYVTQLFPTLTPGVFHQHNTFEPDKRYTVCAFIIDQYNQRRGDVTAFRDAGLALGTRDGHGVMFSINVLNGGVPDTDGTWDCVGAGQYGKGTFTPNCRMTPEQVRTWGAVLGTAGCGGLFMWRYDGGYFALAPVAQAVTALGDTLGRTPSRPCVRR